jgi:hypothetical protein
MPFVQHRGSCLDCSNTDIAVPVLYYTKLYIHFECTQAKIIRFKLAKLRQRALAPVSFAPSKSYWKP